jgi:hypothetical protein
MFVSQLREAFPTAPDNVTPSRGRPESKIVPDMFAETLMKGRMGWPYYALAHVVSDSNGSLQRHVVKCRNLMNRKIGKRLFHLQSPGTIRANRPHDWPEALKVVLLIGDGHPKTINKSGIFIVQRITYSSYKSENIFLWVLCKWFADFEMEIFITKALQSFHLMV